jgi:uncharacterized repeat protein (TIGR03803 family)
MTFPLRNIAIAVVALTAVIAPGRVSAGTFETLYAFPNPNPTPYFPWGGLTAVGGMLCGTTYEGGTGGRGTVIEVSPTSGAVTVLASFTGGNGAAPFGGLTSANGMLYGTTFAGGSKGLGTVFAISPSTGVLTSLYSFDGSTGANPVGSLVYSHGFLYGAAETGGSSGVGTIFKINATSGAAKVLASLTGGSAGAYPYGGLAEIGSTLYGTADYGGANGLGTIFSVDSKTGRLTTLYAFQGGNDGGDPSGSLIAVGSTLYGTTEGTFQSGINGNGGTVFKFVPATGVETVLHDFVLGSMTDGFSPGAGLIESGGVLYGTTVDGGPSYGGVVFAVNASTGAETVLSPLSTVSFAPVTLIGGKLYGMTIGENTSGPEAGLETGGTVFELPVAGGSVTNLATFSGLNPSQNGTSPLVDDNGTLFGTTAQGGSYGNGAVFTVSTSTGTEATLALVGYLPDAGLTPLGSLLYGTTLEGGSGNGSIYSVDPTTGTVQTVYSFTGGDDGVTPKGGLLADSGSLYGTAEGGGANYGGTVYMVNATTGHETTLYSFSFGNDGGYPNAALIKVGNLLYGTTTYGGAGYAGVVFSVNTRTHAETVLHAFTGAGSPLTNDGAYPAAGLVNVGGTLYGTAESGGAYTGSCFLQGCGIIYAINPTTGAETILHAFSGGVDGAYPQGALISVRGKLYATTGGGGAYGNGTLIEINPTTGAVTTLYSFTGIADGADPAAALINLGGVFYGTTNGGGPGNAGTVFKFTP